MSPLRSAAPRDQGLSLVELLVAMGVLSIVMVVVTNLFVTVTAATQSANSARSAVGQASNAMDELARVIRMGTPNPSAGNTTPDPAIVAGTAGSLTVISYVDSAAQTPMPTKASFSFSSGVLQETRTASVASGSLAVFTGAVSTRTLASGLTSVVFGYAAADGTMLTPGTSGLSAAQRALARTVTVTVTAPNTTGRTSDPIVLTSTVLLTNSALADAAA